MLELPAWNKLRNDVIWIDFRTLRSDRISHTSHHLHNNRFQETVVWFQLKRDSVNPFSFLRRDCVQSCTVASSNHVAPFIQLNWEILGLLSSLHRPQRVLRGRSFCMKSIRRITEESFSSFQEVKQVCLSKTQGFTTWRSHSPKTAGRVGV